MTEHDTGLRIPLTPDEELLGADRPRIESLHTDDERLERMRGDLEMGFRALEGTRGVSVFGSARVGPTSPTTRSAGPSAPRSAAPASASSPAAGPASWKRPTAVRATSAPARSG